MTQPPPGYRTQSPDTSYDVEQILIEAYRRMSLVEKARRIAETCQAVEQLAIAGIRSRYPDASVHELRLRLGALRLGRALMVELFGWDPDRRGY